VEGGEQFERLVGALSSIGNLNEVVAVSAPNCPKELATIGANASLCR
jgi:hypothetical protein